MDLITGKILGYVLVLCRIGAFFSVAPILSWSSIPKRVMVALTVLMGVFFAANTPYHAMPESLNTVKVILLMTNEIIYGLAMGYVCMILFSTIKMTARIAEREMGLTMANILNPLSGENAQALSILMEMMFILLFFSANGHHVFFMIISRSFDSFPLGTMPQINTLLNSIIVSGTTMLTLGLKMAAPILAAFLLMMVVLAVMARVAPEANILFLSLPLKVGLGLTMVGIFLPFINDFITEFAKLMDKLIPI